MDPISITASLVTILGIAGSAAKLSKTLYSVANKAGPAGLGIKGFALDVTTFASIVELAHKSLDEHCNVQNRIQPSLILQIMKEQNLLDQLVAQSESVLDHIKLVRPRLKSISGRFAIIIRLKWHLMQPEIQALSLRVGSAKMNLHLIIGLVSLEAAMQQEPSAETRNRIKGLERQVRQYSRLIRLLNDEIKRHNIGESRNVARPVQDVLIDLEQRMTSHSRRSRSTRSHSFGESTHTHHIQELRTPSSLVGEETPPPRTRYQYVTPWLDTTTVPSTTPSSHPIRNILHVQNSSSSLNSGRSRPISITRNEANFVPASPINHVLELSTEGEIESVTGYINGVYVTAILNHDFDANLISQAQVIKYGLEIQPTSEDNTFIKFSSHQEHREASVGTATLEWSNGPSSTRRPFTVHCFVCTHNIPAIILGRPFRESLAHYWPTRPRV